MKGRRLTSDIAQRSQQRQKSLGGGTSRSRVESLVIGVNRHPIRTSNVRQTLMSGWERVGLGQSIKTIASRVRVGRPLYG